MTVAAAILGHHGMLGSVVERRWRELGADIVTLAEADYVVNCIRPDDLLLSERLAESSRLIQPSTDAIGEDSDYAVGKRLLERLPAVTIRAGIVDIRHAYPFAYRDWRCNPITPLEWADLAWELRDRPGVHVAGREAMSRYAALSLAACVFELQQPAAAYSMGPKDRVMADPVRSWSSLGDALLEYREWLG